MGKGWDERLPGSGGALASRQHAKGHPKKNNKIIRKHHNEPRDEVPQGQKRWYQKIRRTGELETCDNKISGNNRGTGRLVEGGIGGECTGAEEG